MGGLFALTCLVFGLAQADTIGLYADPSGTSCNITATASLTFVYVVHVSPLGTSGCAFSAPKPSCWTGATWLGDQDPYCLIGCGDSQTGKMVGYGSCLVGSIHVSTIMYLALGPSEPCCAYPVLPHPDSPGGQIEVVDCDFNPGSAVGLMGMVNGSTACPCGYPVLVEETTWGSIKALYGE
jgi:hypothetical protein